ncbi:alpha/beta hydrolase [Wenzhouxiangella limi]|uniref:Alpha/beta hydrolase n=1 Tax=Wenzhouxiangella limi TaxID=2707351 RepID=A0A845V2X5_9GAMM|nr:alpha/beta hydrolase [Wenzhouxiangella limi]NDY96620.1 alpha/beta hydrolase [Wenzhouxiangella limi]
MVSWQTRTAALLGRLTIRQSLKRDFSIAEMRARIRSMERFFPAVPDDIRIDLAPGLAHCDAEWLTPHNGPTERVILHLPGGAFMTRFVRAERLLLARLCRAANARGRLVFYRLAPEDPFPAGLDDSLEAYRQLLDQGVSPQHIIVSGMSAGGCLALALLLKLRDLGLPAPAAGVLMSPAADLTDASESGSRIDNAASDAVLSMERGDDIRQLYLGGQVELVNHPYVSPVLGDYAGLPPLLFQVGSTEILLDDSQRCAERARAAGVRAEVEVWDRMPHGWQALSFAPESGRAIARMGDFIRESCP